MIRVRHPLLWVAVLAVLPLVLAIGVLLVSPTTVQAATITVKSAGEDLIPNNQCTLLEALNNANNDALTHADCLVAGGGADTINFDINPASCSMDGCLIQTTLSYIVTAPVTINGYTQPGASANTLAVGTNAALRIHLQPANSSAITALRIQANDVTVRGLVISGYDQSGIEVESGARARIAGNYIGTDIYGTQAPNNGDGGIFVQSGASATVIGGTLPADRNVISGHDDEPYGFGIFLNLVSGVTIQGNYIGTNAAGIASIPNLSGIFVRGSSSNTIGGTTAGARNVISGNSTRGIVLVDAEVPSSSNAIQGNFIGYNAPGDGFVANGGGIFFSGVSNNLIGGTETGAGNRIGGNTTRGVELQGGSGNRVLGTPSSATVDSALISSLGRTITRPFRCCSTPASASARRSRGR
jgi:hypothetical protein